MKSPNCSASALSLACIEFRRRLTAGGVPGLRSGAAVRSPRRGAHFRAYPGYRARAAKNRNSPCGEVFYCHVVARRHGRGGMALGVCPRHRLGSRRLGAPVAQLDRALPSEGRGQGFESLRVRQTNMLILFVNCRLLLCEIPAKICRGNTRVTPIRNSKSFFATIHPPVNQPGKLSLILVTSRTSA
jgi:hypothetical protein